MVYLVAGGFALFAVLNLVYSVIQWRFSLSLTITGWEVVKETTTLFGRRGFRESLRSYRGVLLRQEEVADTPGDSDFTTRYCIIELLHADPAKTVPLHVRRQGPSPIDLHRAFAERLHLPALDDSLAGPAPTPRTFPDPGPAPPSVLIRQSGTLTAYAPAPSRLSRLLPWLAWPFLPAVVYALVAVIDRQFALIASGFALVLVLVILAAGRLMHGRSPDFPLGVCLDDSAIWIGHPGQPPHNPVPLASVRAIGLDHPHGASARIRLSIDAGPQSISLAVSRRHRPAFEWIRARLLHLIARQANGFRISPDR